MPITGYKVRKAAQTVAFFAQKAGGQINILIVTKLVYLADREFMKKYDCPIIYDNFVSMPHGPVNSLTLDYINGCYSEDQENWDRYITGRADYNVGLADANLKTEELDELSEAELEIMEEIWRRFGGMDKYELRDYTHKYCPEWENPHGSSAPIPYSRVFKFLDKADPEFLDREIAIDRELLSVLQGGSLTEPLAAD